jgi:hypothetical protein
VKQTLFHVLVHCKHTLDQGRLRSVLNHIAGCLKSALVSKSTVELYCDLDGLQALGGWSISADVMVQVQKPDLAIVDRSVYGRFRIALVKLTCPWDMDAKRAKECKTARLKPFVSLKLSSFFRIGLKQAGKIIGLLGSP